MDVLEIRRNRSRHSSEKTGWRTIRCGYLEWLRPRVEDFHFGHGHLVIGAVVRLELPDVVGHEAEGGDGDEEAQLELLVGDLPVLGEHRAELTRLSLLLLLALVNRGHEVDLDVAP